MKMLSLVFAATAIVFSAHANAMRCDSTVSKSVVVHVMIEGYEPIEISELPEAVATAAATDFAGASISEAYKDGADNYKLVLTVGEESKTVYANASGEWIEPNE